MATKVIHLWTLAGLMRAFVNLAIAYWLLCVSAFAFVPSKILSLFELYMPCPCSGFFGYKNSDLCFHELLIDWPTSKISHVLELVRGRFPFDMIWLGNQSWNLHGDGVRCRKCENEIFRFEGEACCSSFSGAKLENRVDGQSKYDAKGKKIMNQKLKTGIRRRTRASLGYGKVSAALSPNSRRSVVIGVFRPPYDGDGIKSETSESLDPLSRTENGLLDYGNAPSGSGFGERIWSGFELSGSNVKNKGINKDLSSVEICNAENSPSIVGNDANAIRVLEQALEGERAARAALYQELEKERAAAATAADEAMAMIYRLQEEKASIEMEVRQYQRMMDEKFAYDEEEMNILKEILVRRERENHFLEKELEGYRQIDFSGKEELQCLLSGETDSSGQRPSVLVDPNDNPLLLMRLIEKCKFIDEKEVATAAKFSSNGFGRGMTSCHQELTPDLSTSYWLSQEKINLAQIDMSARDASMITEGVNGELVKDEEHWNKGLHSSFLDTEPTVYDVHVIDDKTIL